MRKDWETYKVHGSSLQWALGVEDKLLQLEISEVQSHVVHGKSGALGSQSSTEFQHSFLLVVGPLAQHLRST